VRSTPEPAGHPRQSSPASGPEEPSQGTVGWSSCPRPLGPSRARDSRPDEPPSRALSTARHLVENLDQALDGQSARYPRAGLTGQSRTRGRGCGRAGRGQALAAPRPPVCSMDLTLPKDGEPGKAPNRTAQLTPTWRSWAFVANVSAQRDLSQGVFQLARRVRRSTTAADSDRPATGRDRDGRSTTTGGPLRRQLVHLDCRPIRWSIPCSSWPAATGPSSWASAPPSSSMEFGKGLHHHRHDGRGGWHWPSTSVIAAIFVGPSRSCRGKMACYGASSSAHGAARARRPAPGLGPGLGGGVAFHALALFFIVRGFQAARRLAAPSDLSAAMPQRNRATDHAPLTADPPISSRRNRLSTSLRVIHRIRSHFLTEHVGCGR